MSNFLSPPEPDEKMPISWAEAFAKQLKELQEKIKKDANDPRDTVPPNSGD